MNIIQYNPYRILGLLVGATTAEQRRQTTRLKRFLEADLEPEEDFSFSILGELVRTVDLVNDAESKLNLNSDKMNAALFWFYKGNSITDESAFDAIKLGDIDEALNIWTNLVSNGEISELNASAFNNLGTLYLTGVLNNGNLKETEIKQGVNFKLKFLESDFTNNLKTITTDETFQITKKELQLQFINQVQAEIEKSNVITLNQFLKIVTKQDFTAKDDYLKGYAQQPIEKIERRIEESKAKRKADKSNAIQFGENLYNQTIELLKEVKSILGESNISYSSIADKLANEVLQCSIDYYNYHNSINSNINYLEATLDLAYKAKQIPLGKLTKDRIKDNLDTLENDKLYRICFYCNKNYPTKKATYIRDLYKGTSYSYQYIQTRTPRCEHCKEIHERSSILFLRIPMIVLPILMLSLNPTPTIVGNIILGLILGFMLGLLITYFLSPLETFLKIKKTGIKKESDFTKFEPVQKLINEGWYIDKPNAY